VNNQNFDVQLSNDGSTVWVTAADGSCVGRFSKKFGLDVHTTATEQLDGKPECLHCTHSPAGPDEWAMFCTKVKAHHQIVVPVDLIRWN
jgi:hypothetical protein